MGRTGCVVYLHMPLFAEYDASANVDDGSCVTLAVPNFTCGNNVTYQGYDYATVLIETSVGLLRTWSEYYENGEAISSYLSDPEWSSTTSGAVTLYGEGSTTCDNYSPDGDACNELWSLNEYGRLYNWYAVTDPVASAQTVGIPSDAEWTILTDHLGGEFVAGDAMKTTYRWPQRHELERLFRFAGRPPAGYWKLLLLRWKQRLLWSSTVV